MPASPSDSGERLESQVGAEMKSCPDCAELVRAEARRCRFCGYRFDADDPPEKGSGLLGLLGLKKARRHRSVSQLLAAWGLRLGEQEQVAMLAFASLAGRSGFLVLTDERLCFFAMPKAEKLVELPLSGLTDVRSRRRYGRRMIQIDCGAQELLFTHFSGAQARAVVAYLRERLAPSREDGVS